MTEQSRSESGWLSPEEAKKHLDRVAGDPQISELTGIEREGGLPITNDTSGEQILDDLLKGKAHLSFSDRPLNTAETVMFGSMAARMEQMHQDPKFQDLERQSQDASLSVRERQRAQNEMVAMEGTYLESLFPGQQTFVSLNDEDSTKPNRVSRTLRRLFRRSR